MSAAAAIVGALVAGAWIVLAGGSSHGRLATISRRQTQRAARRAARRAGSSGYRARTPPLRSADLALMLDLVAAGMRAGSPPPAALHAACAALSGTHADQLRGVTATLALGGSWQVAWADLPASLRVVERALRLAWHSGAAAAALLESAADDLRRRDRRQASAAAERLGVRLVLPLALCALPAFVLLGLAPVLLSLGMDLLAAG